MSSSGKLLVVIGVTGTQGGSVASTFLTIPGWRVRGITRNPKSASAQSWKQKGVEIVGADLDDSQSLIAAFQGAYAIFGVTDFWMHLNAPENADKAKKAGVSINEFAFNEEVRQGMAIAQAANDPSVANTLRRFVFSALSSTRKCSNGTLLNNWHFDSKAEVVERIQQELPDLAEKMSTVQIGHYMTNWKMGIGQPQKQSNGSYIVPTVMPTSEAPQIPFVATNRDTGVFVKALLLNAEPNTHVFGYSQMATYTDFWSLWAEVNKVELGFKQVSLDDYCGDLPVEKRIELVDSAAYNARFGWTGGDPSVVDVWKIDPEAKTTSMREYIEHEDWSSILHQ